VGEAAGKRAKIGLRSQISLQFHDYPGLARPNQSLYGAARIGDIVVNRNFRLTPSGWALLVLGAAALALGGCGRKGGLDLPPNAMNSSSAVPEPDSEAERASQPSVYNPTYGSESGPTAPKGRKKPFILDPLLGN
jgi:predicted small lipoprotein YifL